MADFKCPFRKITTVEKNENKTIIKKDFQDCLGSDCPYYIREQWSYSRSSIVVPAHCGKV